MANGDLIKLGTFYLGGTKRARPTKPWRSDTTPPGAPSVGNIPNFSAGQTIEIRDTDANDAYKIQWREVNDGNKKLLICDRVLLAQVSWDDLNAQGLVSGKTITIDGQQYKLRLLTGGSNYRNTSDAYAGGTPTNNEWDRIIVNEAGFSGLPTPAASDLNSTADSTDFSSAHNQYWNWFYMYSWAQEVYTGDSALRAFRGSDSARYWGYYIAANRLSGLGWRPVLEVLNSAPSVVLTSPGDNQTLVEGNTYVIAGTATEADAGNVVTVKYKIDNGSTYNITAAVSDGTTPINFSKTLTYLNNRLYDGQNPVTPILDDNVTHKLTVWAEDDQGGKSSDTTRNFTVLYNQPPQISGSDQDLGSIAAPPSIPYSVTDLEGYSFTVTEAIDGNTIRSFPGVDGQQETLTIPADIWLTLQPDVTHQLTITATDQYNASSKRTYTFKRTVDGVELETIILPADAKPTRTILSLNGQFPEGTNLNVLVCNNAHDPAPTWEDMTTSVLNNRPYLFTNETSISGQWGIKFKISIMPGA